jgi:hypothetical protein
MGSSRDSHRTLGYPSRARQNGVLRDGGRDPGPAWVQAPLRLRGPRPAVRMSARIQQTSARWTRTGSPAGGGRGTTGAVVGIRFRPRLPGGAVTQVFGSDRRAPGSAAISEDYSGELRRRRHRRDRRGTVPSSPSKCDFGMPITSVETIQMTAAIPKKMRAKTAISSIARQIMPATAAITGPPRFFGIAASFGPPSSALHKTPGTPAARRRRV